MWRVTCLLLLGIAAQPGYIPCGQLGEWFKDVEVAVTPEVPSLMDLISFTIYGSGYSDVGIVTLTFALEDENQRIYFQHPNVTLPNGYQDGFNVTLSAELLWPETVKSGVYRYHVYFRGEILGHPGILGPCVQEVVGTVTIGMTLPVTNIDYQWGYDEKSQPTNLTLTGTNNSTQPLNWLNCNILIVNIDKELDPVNCEVTDLLPGDSFSTSFSITGLPIDQNGTYIARIYMSTVTQETVGYVELGLQVGQTITIQISATNRIRVANTGRTAYTITRSILTMIFPNSTLLSHQYDLNTPVLFRSHGSIWFPIPNVYFNDMDIKLQLGLFIEPNLLLALLPFHVVNAEDAVVTKMDVHPTNPPLDGIFFVEIEGAHISLIEIGLYSPNCSYSFQTDAQTDYNWEYSSYEVAVYNLSNEENCHNAVMWVVLDTVYLIFTTVIDFTKANNYPILHHVYIANPGQLTLNGFLELDLVTKETNLEGLETCGLWMGTSYDSLLDFGRWYCYEC